MIKEGLADSGIKTRLVAQKYKYIIFSAILYSISLITLFFPLGWVAFSFLFYDLIKNDTLKRALFSGFLFGSLSTLILTYWTLSVIDRYAQGGVLIAIFCWLALSIIMGMISVIPFGLFSQLRNKQNGALWQVLLNGALLACLWTITEFLRSEMFKGMPWLNYNAGITQSTSLYLVQLASVGSAFFISFVLVLSNYLLAYSFYSKRWNWLFAPLLIFTASFLGGYFLYVGFSAKAEANNDKIAAALILTSLPPETKWDEKNGNNLVKLLLDLNSEAAARQPDLIIWSETIVPWTYADDDDFVAEIAQRTATNKSYSLLGMNTLVDNVGTIHNSAYFFNPTGRLLGRYDKQNLLSGVETPLFGNDSKLILPFMALSGLSTSIAANSALETPWGKAGVFICNEIVVPSAGNSYSREGVSYLVNMANGSWFSNTFIVDQQFYNGRLRAVESRKDLAINNNGGISGTIRANGEIANHFQGVESGVELVEIYPNNFSGINHYHFLYSLIIGVFLIAGYHFLGRR